MRAQAGLYPRLDPARHDQLAQKTHKRIQERQVGLIGPSIAEYGIARLSAVHERKRFGDERAKSEHHGQLLE